MMRAGGGGARLCWLLVGLLAAVPAAGHISAVCSSTSPTHPGSFTFWLATYHDNPALGSVPGQILILEPDGTTPSSAFSNWCSLQNCPTPPCASAIPGIAGESTVEEIAAEMKLAGHCQTVQDATGNFLLHADSVLACYEANVGMDPLRFAVALQYCSRGGVAANLPGPS
ncbi:hypothetical protein DIPPA_31253 [Diplonema papillatum]|nr:hypothetical protein DIPPA_31253 [Diplonema papillatum]